MQKLKFLKPALSLLIITVGVALLLAIVNHITADKIEENAYTKKMQAIEKIYPDIDTYDDVSTEYATDCVQSIGSVKNADGEWLGYFVEVTPQGFKDVISMIVGVDKNGRVIDVVCLSASETAGIGTKATSDSNLKKYAGLDSSSVGSVDTITGATISSKAVRHGIEDACKSIENIVDAGTSIVNSTEVE